MRHLMISISVVASLAAGAAVLDGPQARSSSLMANLFQRSSESELAEREARLKVSMGIRADQEAAWLDYLLARRAYAKALKDRQRQEMKDIASGNIAYGTTLSAADPEAAVKASQSALRQEYEDLYAVLDDRQKALADRELTPVECGL
jgi:hypothetical protein